MRCLDEQTIWELAEGQLSSEEREKALEHLALCERCTKRLKGELQLSSALQMLWEEVHEECPDDATLYDYAYNQLPESSRRSLAEHVKFCSRCKQTVELGTELASTLAVEVAERRQAGEPEEQDEVRLAEHLVRDFIERGWPKLAGSFGALWEAVRKAGELRAPGSEGEVWQERLSPGMALAGVPDVEYTVACLVAVVGLSTCRAVIEGTVQREAAALLAYVKEESQRVGLSGVVAERLGNYLSEHLTTRP